MLVLLPWSRLSFFFFLFEGGKNIPRSNLQTSAHSPSLSVAAVHSLTLHIYRHKFTPVLRRKKISGGKPQQREIRGQAAQVGPRLGRKKNPNKHQKCYISQEMHFHCCTQPTPFSCFTDLHLFEVVLQRRSIHKQGRIKIWQRFQGLPEQRRCVR